MGNEQKIVLSDRFKRVGLDLLDVLVLVLISWMAHVQLLAAGLALMTADGAIYPLVAEYVRRGHWSVFQLQDSYGGIALSVVRAGWIEFAEKFHHWRSGESLSDLAHLNSQLTFSYLVTPILLCVGLYFLARTYLNGRNSARIVGLIAAVDLNSRIVMGDTEFINFYLLAGCVLLILRGRYQNPWMEMPKRTLFSAAIFGGFAVYTSRAAWIYWAAFLFPWAWVRDEAKKIWVTPFWGRRAVFWGVGFLGGLAAYLEFTGASLGSLAGHEIKIHASPNLNLMFGLLLATWGAINYRRIGIEQIQRALCIGSGFLIGFWPEIQFWAQRGMSPPMTGGRNYSMDTTFMILARVPANLGEIMGGGPGVLRNASIILAVIAMVSLFRAVRNQPRLVPLVTIAVLATVAFSRVFTYTIAPLRYFLPILPVLLVSVGVYWDSLRTRGAMALAAILLVAHIAYQLQDRHRLVQTALASGRAEQVLDVVQLFRSEQVVSVVSDDFWFSNQFSVAANLNPLFTATEHGQVLPRESEDLARASQRIGVILKKERADEILARDQVVNFFGARWHVRPLKTAGDRAFLLGVRE